MVSSSTFASLLYYHVTYLGGVISPYMYGFTSLTYMDAYLFSDSSHMLVSSSRILSMNVYHAFVSTIMLDIPAVT